MVSAMSLLMASWKLSKVFSRRDWRFEKQWNWKFRHFEEVERDSERDSERGKGFAVLLAVFCVVLFDILACGGLVSGLPT